MDWIQREEGFVDKYSGMRLEQVDDAGEGEKSFPSFHSNITGLICTEFCMEEYFTHVVWCRQQLVAYRNWLSI